VLLDLDRAAWPELLPGELSSPQWGVASETGRLYDVLLGAPDHLSMVPCNAVTCRSLAEGRALDPIAAATQRGELARALTRAGVRCHMVPSRAGLADLTFTRDSVLVSPWGLVELRPGASHRRAEPAHVAAALEALGLPRWGRVEAGRIEGGDVCLMREGLLAIGCSGERTDAVGAQSLARLFEAKGWTVILVPFDPAFLHLDTIFTMIAPDCAVACPEALPAAFRARLAMLGIRVIPATPNEVARLGANLLSLGEGRIVAPADNRRLNAILGGCGFDVIAVDLDQFTRCGGGVHCLTMPLARAPEWH